MTEWMKGQRCASQGEPTLGLGIVKQVTDRNLHIFFPATQTERVYAARKPPLRRVVFEVGEAVTDQNGSKFVVREVREQNGILFYLGETEILPETELDAGTVYSRPDQQLLAGHIFKPIEFDLRASAWTLKHKALSSQVRGLVGPRIQLLPHQLYIAQQISNRHQPKILLSDEVGLGKTIEAGLIFHKLWICGDVKRALILVPGTLIHQWLTELFRKFNILFNLMSVEHAEELKTTHPEMNPYLAHQCILQNADELLANEDLMDHILDTDWDLLIVDEAHHLHWSKNQPSPYYALVESLAQRSSALLLLTATPRQLGIEGHFGRLKLLDPQRFNDFEAFCNESQQYQEIARLTDQLLAGRIDDAKPILTKQFPKDTALHELIPTDPSEKYRIEKLIEALLDRHGTGRMVYRNRRKVMPGFPKRSVEPIYLETNPVFEHFHAIFENHIQHLDLAQRVLAGPPALETKQYPSRVTRAWQQKAWQADPRLQWLVPFLRNHLDDKFLLICSSKKVALALQDHLAQVKELEIACFHENLSILERDRQANYFSKSYGAQILICSEIGSEGRNFQFVNKLILFDLPLNPALLEQRIGRLDRIGQSRDIEILVPIPKFSPVERVFRWYHEAFQAFDHPLLEGDFLFDNLKDDIPVLFHGVPKAFDNFLKQSKTIAKRLKESLEQGRDKLLERHSYDEVEGQATVEAIGEVDSREDLKAFMDGAFDLFGVNVEDQEEPPTQILRPSSHMIVSKFPGLPAEGLEITYNRELAIEREELAFLTYDHPMTAGTIDQLLNLDRGVTSFSLWKKAPTPGILVQCLWILECPGAGEFGLERYLPPTPFLVTIDQNKKIRSDLQELLEDTRLDKGPLTTLHQQRNALGDILSSLVTYSEKEAQQRAAQQMDLAKQKAMLNLNSELERLMALQAINPSIHPEELEAIKKDLENVLKLLKESRTRLDAVRMILMVP